MLSPDVRFEGFTATDWVRVLSLFRPRRTAGSARDAGDGGKPRGGVVAVRAGGKLRKLVHTDAGRLRIDEGPRAAPISAEELAARHHASWAAVLEAGSLEAIVERFGARVRRGDDLIAQSILLLQLAREEHLAGRIDLWPARLRGVPIPSPGVVRGTLESLAGVGKTVVVGLFEGGELWTSVALRRDARGINLILGPDEVREDMGLLAGDWRRDYRHLSRAIEERAGELSLGCFAEAETIRKLEVDPSPGAWARAVAVRDVILAPVPAALAIPLGIDAGRAALAALRSIAERIDPMGVVGPAVRAVLERAGTDSDMAAMLPFHPLELLRKLLSRER
ncbi:hypothetical protein SOCE26_000360 [Sorangium cellulosum]|uniref:Uncharacterized protein n=1 Tax=Sorangium cellulosum TaxID=56 RepID=A0A2L0EH96_SORCE|nr:hypothetical protein [Sorangium cellulosum]AUX38658.1 hypothetical protein SOCE26_000360 [Sorangium cellulosum]